MSLDYATFQLINNIAGNKPALDFMMVAITDFGIPLIAMIVLFYSEKKTIHKTALSVTAMFIIDFIIKLIYFRQRPFADHEVNLLIDHLQTASFPSRHTDLAFAAATPILTSNKTLGITAIIIATLVGLSRIYNGVHYPTDVIAGAALGIIIAIATSKIYEKLK